MKFDVSKSWIEKRAHLEEGLEVGAGNLPTIDWWRFPLKEMYKRSWFKGFSGSLSAATNQAEELVSAFLGQSIQQPLVARLRQHVRAGSTPDAYALLAWQRRILTVAKKDPGPESFRQSRLTDEWFQELVQLSRF